MLQCLFAAIIIDDDLGDIPFDKLCDAKKKMTLKIKVTRKKRLSQFNGTV